MPTSVKIEGLSAALADAEADVAKAMTGAMKDATTFLKDELRDQIGKAGLGARLANTWRGQVYPKSGTSIEPAGYVWSKAPSIVASYAEGATIRPVAGHRYLALPTANTPFARGVRGRRRADPHEVELQFNQDLILRRGKRGSILGFVDVAAARRGKQSARQTPPGRRAQGTVAKLVLMFVFVRQVKKQKLLDLDGAADRAAARVVALAEQRLGA